MIIKVKVTSDGDCKKSENDEESQYYDASEVRLEGQKQENLLTDQSEDTDFQMSYPYSRSSQPTSRDRHSGRSLPQMQQRAAHIAGQEVE